MGPSTNDRMLDERQLAQFVHDLNVARRFIVAYPANHPLLLAAEQKVATLGAQLLASAGTITFGVGKDLLLLGTEPLDRQHPAFATFARLLYSHGVVAISFAPGVTPDEFHILNELLGRKPELVRQEGGIASLLLPQVTNILLREIDYDAFTATDDLEAEQLDEIPEGGLWQKFVMSVLAGALDLAGEEWQGVDLDDVDALTQIVLEHGGTEQVRQLIVNFCRALSNLTRQLRKGASTDNAQEIFKRVGQFIEGLSPELQQQFLQSTLNTLVNDPDIACKVLESMSPQLVLDSLQNLSDQGMKLPPMVLGLIQVLAKNADTALPLGFMREQEASDRLRELFREDDLDQFVPASYQETLHDILAGVEPLPDSQVQPEVISELLATTASHELETKTSDIILEILKNCPDEAMVTTLQCNLLELCDYFLEMGDFARLIELHERIAAEEGTDPLMSMVRDNVLQVFSSDSFIQEVFHGLGFWGKAKYEDIQKLMVTVGEPFVEPLLERLAEEQNMSLRRFYMERLLENGPVIQSHLLARLRDNRWYFVRNLLILLRAINNPLVCKPVHRLFNHPHPRVRAEVLRTLLHYGDAEADKILLQQLDSAEEETLYSALQLAEKSANKRVFAKLLALLDRGSLTNYEYKLKSTVVNTLAEIGNPEALPRLEQILFSGAILHAGSHARLKADIMRTLDHYPAATLLPLLKRVIEKGSNELVRQAEDIYRLLQRKAHGSSAENPSA